MIKATPPRHLQHQCPRSAFAAALLCAFLATTYSLTAWSATTQIDNEPLGTRPSVKAKPNLMVILDTSGSMAWSYMPDNMTEASGTSVCTGWGWNQVCTSIPRYG